MQRVKQATPATITNDWRTGDGTLVDPGNVTVTVTRADGTILYEDEGTSGSGAAARGIELTVADTALLDSLTLTWNSPTYGLDTSHVEIVGEFLFALSEARAIQPLNNTTTYPTAALVAMRTTVEQALEDACGVAFVPRYERETITGDGTLGLRLKWPKVRAIRTASSTYAGTTTTLSASDLLNLTFNSYGGLSGYTWTAGYPWTVGYEHGYDRPPEEIKRAALILAKLWLTSQSRPIDDRAITFNAAEGGTYSLAVPGRNGSFFGHPDVDAAISRYSLAVGVA